MSVPYLFCSFYCDIFPPLSHKLSRLSRQWLSKKGMKDLWNLHAIYTNTSEIKLRSRTNCALESYNRVFNNDFARRHPSLTTFVSGLNDATDKVVARLDNVIARRDVPPTYDDIPFPSIPEDYDEWVVPAMSFSLNGEKWKSPAPAKKSTTKSTREDVSSGVSPVKKAAKKTPLAAPEPVRKSKRTTKK